MDQKKSKKKPRSRQKTGINRAAQLEQAEQAEKLSQSVKRVPRILQDVDDYLPDNGLTVRQKRFCDAYLGPAKRNGALAYRMAGYKADETNANVGAHQLLSLPHIHAYLERRTRVIVKLTKDEVLGWYQLRGAASMADFISFGPDPGRRSKEITWWLDLVKANELQALGQIKKLERRTWPDGSFTVKIELHDQQKAVDKLSQHLGLTDTNERGAGKFESPAGGGGREWGDDELLEFFEERGLPLPDVLSPRFDEPGRLPGDEIDDDTPAPAGE